MASDLLVALGIVSAPEYIERRAGSRATWLTWPNICASGCAFRAQFVVRMRDAPPSVVQVIEKEEHDHSDVLRVDVLWNETRLRGPVLSVAAWLTHAVRAHSSARCIAKLDDDAYIHLPGLEVLVREALGTVPSPESLYMGPMSWFHWYEKIFERSGFGWTFTMSWHLGASCRNVTQAEERCRHRGCGACVGPFPFASGYLAILATPLAAELAGSRQLAEDVRALGAASTLPTRSGTNQFKVMEDIWLGSLLFRQPPARALSYVALSERDDATLVSDGWGLKISTPAVVVHVKNHLAGKQLERFLATHAFKLEAHCRQEYAVRCSSGCNAFLTRAENESMALNPRFADMWSPRLEQSSLCRGSQTSAAFCRVGARKPRQCPKAPLDLLKKDRSQYFAQTQAKAAALLESLSDARWTLGLAKSGVDQVSMGRRRPVER